LTTIINSLCNMLIVTYCNCVGLSKILDCDFYVASTGLKYLKMCVYGDDILWIIDLSHYGRSISVDYVTFVINVMGSLGFRCVNPETEGPVQLETIYTASFLKRGFRKSGTYWLAPLDVDSIVDSVLWWKKGSENFRVGDYSRNVHNQCLEFALHGKDVWEKYVPPLIEVFNKHFVDYKQIHIFEQDFAEAMQLEDVYLKL